MGNICGDGLCVGTIRRQRQPEKIIALVQMEHRRGTKLSFEALRDIRAFDIVSQIASAIVERVMVNNKTVSASTRSYKILNTFSEFMGERKHHLLASTFEAKFHSLFGF